MKNTYQQEFRVIPSAIPLKSPSPDHKSSNNLTPTKSPNAIHIKKSITPSKVNVGIGKKENINLDLSTSIKYQSHSPSYPTKENSSLQQKDEIIRQLKNIINLITENSRHGKSSEDTIELRNQIKILTIENQKLVNIIEKGRTGRQTSITEETLTQLSTYEKEISQLMETLKINENEHEQEMAQIKKLYKNTMNHCKFVEDENKELTKENETLLKLLKQERELKQKLKSSDMSQDNGENESSSKISNKSEKLSLLKIKEQYAENVKLLRAEMEENIRNAFDTMKIVMNDIDVKSITISNRLESIEKMVWDKIRSGEKIRKSQIYIEEAPSSSSDHEKISKDEFSRVENLQLQQKLAIVTSQLEQLRFKYEKICLDTSSISYSKREEEKKKEYQESLLLKNKQIMSLSSEMKMLEEKSQMQIDQMKERNKQRQEELQRAHEEELEKLHSQMEIKVNQLIQTYEKERELLKKDLVIKSASLSDANDMSNQQKLSLLQSLKQMKETTEQKDHEFEAKRAELEQKIIEKGIQCNDLGEEKKALQNRLQQKDKEVQVYKKAHQEKEKELILELMETNKYKVECEQLEGNQKELKEKMEKIQSQKEEIHEIMMRERLESEKSKKQLEVKQNQIETIKEQLNTKRGRLQQKIQDVKNKIEENNQKRNLQVSELQTTILKMNKEIEIKTNESKENLRKYMELEDAMREKEEYIIKLKEEIVEFQKIHELYQKDISNYKNSIEELLEKVNNIENESIERTTIQIEDAGKREGEEEIKQRLFQLAEAEKIIFTTLQSIIQ